MNAGLAAPPLAMRSKSPEQRLGVLHVAGDVVIPEDDYLAGKRAVLFCDRVYGSLAHLALIHDGERAEIALIGAAPRATQNRTRMSAPVKQVLPRHRGMFQSRGCSGPVPVAMPPDV